MNRYLHHAVIKVLLVLALVLALNIYPKQLNRQIIITNGSTVSFTSSKAPNTITSAKDLLAITDFSVGQGGQSSNLLQGLPITFSERIKNNGEEIERPDGNITISSSGGKVLGKLNLSNVFSSIKPTEEITYSEVLSARDIGKNHLFGSYTATLSVNYYKNNKNLSDKLGFWIIPLNKISFLLAALIVGALIIRWLIKHRHRIKEN